MSDPTAVDRMRRHRDEMAAMGFKNFATMLPAERIEFIKAEKKALRVASIGDALDALLSELEELRQYKEERATG